MASVVVVVVVVVVIVVVVVVDKVVVAVAAEYEMVKIVVSIGHVNVQYFEIIFYGNNISLVIPIILLTYIFYEASFIFAIFFAVFFTAPSIN